MGIVHLDGSLAQPDEVSPDPNGPTRHLGKKKGKKLKIKVMALISVSPHKPNLLIQILR